MLTKLDCAQFVTGGSIEMKKRQNICVQLTMLEAQKQWSQKFALKFWLNNILLVLLFDALLLMMIQP